MSYYCYLDSNENLEHTNLQLYSLQKAAIDWNELIDSSKNNRIVPKGHLRERLAFILSCLGLSLSQLLGQNCPSPKKDKMDQPGDLLNTIFINADVDRTKRRHLNKSFEDFLSYYNVIRHFGKNKDGYHFRIHPIIKVTSQSTRASITI